MTRIAFLGWADHIHTERWAGHIAGLGNEVCVLSTSGLGRYPPSVTQIEINPRARSRAFSVLALRWHLARIKPQLLHVHWAHFAMLAARADWRGPLVVTAWGSDIYSRERFTEGEWIALGSALRRADLVTCDSQDQALRLCDEFGVAPEAVSVIQWGVDTEAFAPREALPGLLQRIGFAGHPVVLSARNFTPVYNQETVLQAFQAVHRARPEVRLLMKRNGGDAAYNARIEALIPELGLADSVHILESVPYADMPEVYRSACITLSMPHSDGTPMSVLEAMASGSVPVVSDLPSLREWIVDGENGYLLPTTDAEGLAARVLQLLDSPDAMAAMAARNRHIVQERASQRFWMQQMQAHYERLTGRPAARPDARASA